MTAELALSHPHKRIWAIAGPAIIANSSAPLVGLVDTWVIGHLPNALHLAAVSVGAMVFSYIFWAFGFLRMSTTGMVAQAHGQKDDDQLRRVMVRAAMLGLLIGTILLLLQPQIFSLALAALTPPKSTEALFRAYFDIRIWSAPASLMIYAINGYLIGVARARTALMLQLVLNITNGVLNLVFVLGLDMGVSGIALGSLIAEWLACLFGLVLLFRALGLGATLAAARQRLTWSADKLLKLLNTNGFIFIRTLMLMTALGLVTREAGKLGAAELAASHVLSTFLMLISLGLDGFAYAAEALAGAAYGRKNRREFRAWVKVTFLWVALAAVFYTLGFALFGEALIYTLTDIAAVRDAATYSLPVLVALPVIAFACYQYDGVYIGATAGGAMMGTMAIAFAAFLLVLAPLTDAYGLMGLWLAVGIFMGMRGLAQAVYYPRIERRLDAGSG
ncbi:MATE family efflux transporter [Kordiimonas sp.]|uniref:MATE family efflux transporter n=1 Tax=Kordiimonas sp. TaxID=1970157 RepID=UPI003A90AEE9